MHRTLALLQSLLLLAFVLTRAIVPAGFMPSGQGALGFDWCPSQSAAVVEYLNGSAHSSDQHNQHAHHSAHHQANPHHHNSNNDSTEQISPFCDFAWLNALLIAPELALALLAFALLLLPRFKLGIHLRHRFYLPPARAPPLVSFHII